jgi:hypothetical protein
MYVLPPANIIIFRQRAGCITPCSWHKLSGNTLAASTYCSSCPRAGSQVMLQGKLPQVVCANDLVQAGPSRMEAGYALSSLALV